MSLIHKPAHERIEVKGVSGPDLLNIFEVMAQESEDEGHESGQCLVSYLDETDEFKTGTYVPELWIVVRKIA